MCNIISNWLVIFGSGYESMSPEILKNSLVLIKTRYDIEYLKVGQNIAYILGKVEATHKITDVKNGIVRIRSLVDKGTSIVTADTYLVKAIFSIPNISGWIRSVLDYK